MKTNKCLKINSDDQAKSHTVTHSIRSEVTYAIKSAPISTAREAQLSELAKKVLHDNMEAWKTLAKE